VFLPSMYPRPFNCFMNAVSGALRLDEEPGERDPTRHIRRGCCARATNGHAAAAPPTKANAASFLRPARRAYGNFSSCFEVRQS
jgi:hypothetical protein